MRLIDADALVSALNNGRFKEQTGRAVPFNAVPFNAGVAFALTMVEYAQTIDAVPVVRCKDCKWYVRSIIKQDGTLDKRYKPDWCDLYRKVREETYFCADGERKDDE